MVTVEPAPTSGAPALRTAWLVTLAAGVVRLLLAAWIPLFPDETYYWDWSRHLAAGYFDHPPGVAVLIRAGTGLGALLGIAPSPLLVRLGAVVAGVIASAAAVGIANRIGGGRAARIAAVAFALMPLAATGLVLATPDAPLLAACAVGLYCVVRAVERDAKALHWWAAAGLFLGLAFASKYTSILLPITVVAAVAMRRSLRPVLRTPGPWVACIVAVIVFLPVLLWNREHDWLSFRFQLQHGLGAPKGSALKRELDLIGGQLGLVSPIYFGLAAWAVVRALRGARDDRRFVLAVVAAGCWLFFAWSALRRPVEANWPAPSYIAAIALLAVTVHERRTRRWWRAGTVLAGLLVAVIYIHALVPILPLPARRDPLARSAGWAEVATLVERVRAGTRIRTHVAADRYQDVSELAWHLPGRPQVFALGLVGRHNQYELWHTFPQVARTGDDLVALLDERDTRPPAIELLAPYFTAVEQGARAPLLRNGDTVAVRRIWRLSGYRGGWPARVEP